VLASGRLSGQKTLAVNPAMRIMKQKTLPDRTSSWSTRSVLQLQPIAAGQIQQIRNNFVGSLRIRTANVRTLETQELGSNVDHYEGRLDFCCLHETKLGVAVQRL